MPDGSAGQRPQGCHLPSKSICNELSVNCLGILWNPMEKVDKGCLPLGRMIKIATMARLNWIREGKVGDQRKWVGYLPGSIHSTPYGPPSTSRVIPEYRAKISHEHCQMQGKRGQVLKRTRAEMWNAGGQLSGTTIDVTSPAKLRSGVIAIRDGQTESVPDPGHKDKAEIKAH